MEVSDTDSTAGTLLFNQDYYEEGCSLVIYNFSTEEIFHEEGDANWSFETLRRFCIQSRIVAAEEIYDCWVYTKNNQIKVSLNSEKGKLTDLVGKSEIYRIDLCQSNKSGGGPVPLNFNNLQQPITRKLVSATSNDPCWVLLSKGLNLQGTCVNECKAKDQRVWVQIGYGKFYMEEITSNAQCPQCKQPLKSVNNMGLRMCTADYEGKIVNEQKPRKSSFIVKQQHSFLTFENKDETKADWVYLKIDVKKL